MKKTLSLLIVIIIVIGCKKSCDEKVISKGKINENWEYINKELGLKLQLPKDWFIEVKKLKNKQFISMENKVPQNIFKYDTIKIKSNFNLRRGSLDMSEIFTIYDSKPIEVNYPSEIQFAIIHSKYEDENKDIEDICKQFEMLITNDKEVDNYNKKGIKVNTSLNFNTVKIPSIKTCNRRSDGKIEYIIAALKNYGCFNFILIYRYHNEVEYNKIVKILNTTKLE
ncbi:hypothetical protein [Flavobacterium urocaniciphilum]|uniref:Lipoprotein n=1 Tax=Flavobacterium urocaniciphilum TaxID=1299341 RepID=A0A1H8Z705_9FLAO|nr:hypothetical protein [Flavobacterium urocaniciphilum]SEP60220.1 hypothetical protein SAMN05444005_101529 [Flavobacterium urocaniciphilum]